MYLKKKNYVNYIILAEENRVHIHGWLGPATNSWQAAGRVNVT